MNELGENATADLFCGVFVGGDCGDAGAINDWTVSFDHDKYDVDIINIMIMLVGGPAW